VIEVVVAVSVVMGFIPSVQRVVRFLRAGVASLVPQLKQRELRAFAQRSSEAVQAAADSVRRLLRPVVLTSDTRDARGVSSEQEIFEERLWQKNGWIARVIKNEDDDGWAVAMTRVGDSEPALVGPWTMGRDKRNPKPLDAHAFSTLVKTANEILLRHEQAARARLHQSRTITDDQDRRIRVDFDIVPDEDDPHAILAAFDDSTAEPIAHCRVSPMFKLTEASAQRFVRTGEA